MKRPNFVQLLSIVLAAALVVAVVGVSTESLGLTGPAIRVALFCTVLLFLAPALMIGAWREGHVVSRGLGRAARLSGFLAVLFGILLIAVMFLAMSLAFGGLLLAIFFIVVGTFAMRRVDQTRPAWVDGPPLRAYLVPALAGAVTLALLQSVVLKLPAWNWYRLSVGVDLEHLVQSEELVKKDSGHYTVTPDPRRFPSSPYITPPRITLTPDGFYARAGHKQLSFQCMVYVGSTPPADVGRVDWVATYEPHPKLRPRQVGCLRGYEEDREKTRQVLLLLVALVPALVGLFAAWWRVQPVQPAH